MQILKILITVGIAIASAIGIFMGYQYYQIENKFSSPLPEKDGMKVIIVTPTPENGE